MLSVHNIHWLITIFFTTWYIFPENTNFPYRILTFILRPLQTAVGRSDSPCWLWYYHCIILFIWGVGQIRSEMTACMSFGFERLTGSQTVAKKCQWFGLNEWLEDMVLVNKMSRNYRRLSTAFWPQNVSVSAKESDTFRVCEQQMFRDSDCRLQTGLKWNQCQLKKKGCY